VKTSPGFDGVAAHSSLSSLMDSCRFRVSAVS